MSIIHQLDVAFLALTTVLAVYELNLTDVETYGSEIDYRSDFPFKKIRDRERVAM